MTNRRFPMLAVGTAAALLIPFLVPVPDDLERMRSLRALGVLAHFSLPAVLAVVLYRVGPVRGRLVTAGLCAFALAAGCELLQNFVGRHPRWLDVGVDLAGAMAGVGWIGWREGRGRMPVAAIVLGLMVLLSQTWSIPLFILASRRAAEKVPVLADFEFMFDRALWGHNEGGHGHHGRFELDDGSHALAVRAAPHHVYPGVIGRGLPRDWSEYGTLTFRARIESGSQARITVRLDDFESRRDKRWCQDSATLDASWRTYEFDLASMAASLEERPFRLDDIDSLLLYLTRIEDDVTVLIDDIVLR